MKRKKTQSTASNILSDIFSCIVISFVLFLFIWGIKAQLNSGAESSDAEKVNHLNMVFTVDPSMEGKVRVLEQKETEDGGWIVTYENIEGDEHTVYTQRFFFDEDGIFKTTYDGKTENVRLTYRGY